MVLGVAGQDLLGRAAADLPGVAGRRCARVDRVEVAAGRQNIEAAARRGASRAGGDERSAERSDEPERFGGAASGHALGERLLRRRIEVKPGEAICALGRAAEHVQAVANPHVLEVAEPGIESDQRLLRRLVLRRAFLEQSRFAPSFEDQRRNRARAARIERLRFGEFVE